MHEETIRWCINCQWYSITTCSLDDSKKLPDETCNKWKEVTNAMRAHMAAIRDIKAGEAK